MTTTTTTKQLNDAEKMDVVVVDNEVHSYADVDRNYNADYYSQTPRRVEFACAAVAAEKCSSH